MRNYGDILNRPKVFFITFNVYRRRRLLDLDQPKRIILGVLEALRLQAGLKCIGFVIMPNHVHALLWIPAGQSLSFVMHEWKRRSSLLIRTWYTAKAANYFREFGMGRRFWQPKYYPFEIESREKAEEILDYMHLNPTRSQLVQRAVDWKWSSARWYLARRTVGVPIEWVDF
ncbi:REP-associated tyrosine transposase [Anatilimnocola floriformis]|uniref:REP-associated tyrosine transposase n=1 Tax=Anatilimnocola floriformis TaxID=2948575 RepID=UPI0020C336BF|nr:transposase [Anatilimnocola floriformis]